MKIRNTKNLTTSLGNSYWIVIKENEVLGFRTLIIFFFTFSLIKRLTLVKRIFLHCPLVIIIFLQCINKKFQKILTSLFTNSELEPVIARSSLVITLIRFYYRALLTNLIIFFILLLNPHSTSWAFSSFLSSLQQSSLYNQAFILFRYLHI